MNEKSGFTGPPTIAYFCMEYGLDSNFKQYAGGLGILAGDFLKAAKEYNYPVIGIGLFWKQGYTDQIIDTTDRVIDTYKNYQYDFLEDTGWTVEVTIRQREVLCKVWKCAAFDNVTLYLLDCSQQDNADAWITGQLYGWFGEERIAQEMILGIGGIRILEFLNIPIDRYHLNEGHCLFAALELIRLEMSAGQTYANAFASVRERVVFTTHTPVTQGNEVHPIDRLFYMGADLGLHRQQLIDLGGDPFNMTVASLRLANKSNAVSEIHAETATKMWEHIVDKAPIFPITNGIHRKTWVDPSIPPLAKQKGMDIYEAHENHKKNLIQYVKEKTGQQLKKNILLIGFARRAVAYKRALLFFKQRETAISLLQNHQVQIIFSGRAHPFDDEGKAIIEEIMKWRRQFPEAIVYLENHDMHISKLMTKGVDIWLNNPRRPQEASGTSGMKAAMNGVINLSIGDGWWPEMCRHGENGWFIGQPLGTKDPLIMDHQDALALYKILVDEVIPVYYRQKSRWVKMMKQSVQDCYNAFSAERMIADYYQKLYS